MRRIDRVKNPRKVDVELKQQVEEMSFFEKYQSAKIYIGKVPPFYRRTITKSLGVDQLALNHLRSKRINGW